MSLAKMKMKIVLSMTTLFSVARNQDIGNVCDQTFSSTSSLSSKNGTFTAPVFLNSEGYVRQCTYNFRGLPGERVMIQFEEFNLIGTPPECYHEHVDIFSEMENLDKKTLIETPFGGRFCGQNIPRLRISLYNSLAMVFLSDRKNITEGRFTGIYEFFPDDKFNKIGTKDAKAEGRSKICSFEIFGNTAKNGELYSATYPGTYPKNLKCTYKFIGEPGTRVRLEFRDFDLFYGGAHCPFDRMTIYDGPDNLAEKIGTYCGQMRNLVIYSTKNLLYLTFTTLKRTAPVFNRGFFGLYEFSDNYVKLDFIQNIDAEHIRGTECDQKILSKKESKGQVFSPNYPFPYQPYIVCRYFIYGMQDSQNLERVVLNFEKFDIPLIGVRKNYTERCRDGYVKVYIQGQEEEHNYDKHDYEFCGKTTPTVINSTGPRLVILFKAGSKPGSGFKANYYFETEYQVPGTPAPDGSCMFKYDSNNKLEGRFNSPRHPQNYPNDINCTYMFESTPNQQVMLVFDHFRVRADKLENISVANASLGNWKAYGRDQCLEDYVEIFTLINKAERQLLGRYCSTSSPGPVVSPRGTVGLELFLHTDHDAVYSGFKGRYMYIQAQSPFGDCGGNITDAENGIIKSPNFPEKYTTSSKDSGNKVCHWFVYAKPGYRILLYFSNFEVEGNPGERGCPAAALRVWPWKDVARTPIELCGDTLDQYKEIISDGHVMRLSFYLARKAVGAMGFKAIYTEVKESISCTGPNEFLCRTSGYCIARSLQCNHVKNCGAEDNSDEEDCLKETEVNEFMLIALGMGIASFVAIGLIVYCRRYRKKKYIHREHPMLPPHAHFHTCESIGERFANSTSMDSV
ncbi:dorsal-ventral patterning tolloid-like protein 1 isoform X2 [Eurytemora carolleeae]|uniref:dorsal-ventral patterning tolloid-like protein 1 isoform X2 n=1 Tax=Eurytemora carolleeae TaxID=1294199 RepID=UPI000C761E6F|nr:dorsal-ventral patterning tolloid-like protein 1 isoform X2 [Eurytemora carolleeae]|eukprot:XP_023327852.1 dorsal-ventral patterning tolloid-like protein 1 isoform X2 [Eurytemora affinis]